MEITFVDLVIVKNCRGSEDGIHVKQFLAKSEPQPVAEKLVPIFLEKKWASLPTKGKPGPTETKIVVPEVKAEKKDAEKPREKN
jgi:hypothetical protein